MFPVTVAAGLRWSAAQQEADLLAAVPRYNPRSTYVLTRVPVLRELVTWNLALVLRRR
jgi:hypothetical protein